MSQQVLSCRLSRDMFTQSDAVVPVSTRVKRKPGPALNRISFKQAMENKEAKESERIERGFVISKPLIMTELPAELLEEILKYLSFENIAKIRNVSQHFNSVCSTMLNFEFTRLRALMQQRFQSIKAQMPRRESARRKHPLARESDIIETVHMRLSLLQMTFGKHIERNHCCFFAGEILDEVYRVIAYVDCTPSLNRAYKVTDELFDLSTMAMEYFKERIEPTLPEISYFSTDFLETNIPSPKPLVSILEESITSKLSSTLANTETETVINQTTAIEATAIDSTTSTMQKDYEKLRRLCKRNKKQVDTIKRLQQLSNKKAALNQKIIQQLKDQCKEYDRKYLNTTRKLNAVLQELNMIKTNLPHSSYQSSNKVKMSSSSSSESEVTIEIANSSTGSKRKFPINDFDQPHQVPEQSLNKYNTMVQSASTKKAKISKSKKASSDSKHIPTRRKSRQFKPSQYTPNIFASSSSHDNMSHSKKDDSGNSIAEPSKCIISDREKKIPFADRKICFCVDCSPKRAIVIVSKPVVDTDGGLPYFLRDDFYEVNLSDIDPVADTDLPFFLKDELNSSDIASVTDQKTLNLAETPSPSIAKFVDSSLSTIAPLTDVNLSTKIQTTQVSDSRFLNTAPMTHIKSLFDLCADKIPVKDFSLDPKDFPNLDTEPDELYYINPYPWYDCICKDWRRHTPRIRLPKLKLPLWKVLLKKAIKVARKKKSKKGKLRKLIKEDNLTNNPLSSTSNFVELSLLNISPVTDPNILANTSDTLSSATAEFDKSSSSNIAAVTDPNILANTSDTLSSETAEFDKSSSSNIAAVTDPKLLVNPVDTSSFSTAEFVETCSPNTVPVTDPVDTPSSSTAEFVEINSSNIAPVTDSKPLVNPDDTTSSSTTEFVELNSSNIAPVTDSKPLVNPADTPSSSTAEFVELSSSNIVPVCDQKSLVNSADTISSSTSKLIELNSSNIAPVTDSKPLVNPADTPSSSTAEFVELSSSNIAPVTDQKSLVYSADTISSSTSELNSSIIVSVTDPKLLVNLADTSSSTAEFVEFSSPNFDPVSGPKPAETTSSSTVEFVESSSSSVAPMADVINLSAEIQPTLKNNNAAVLAIIKSLLNALEEEIPEEDLSLDSKSFPNMNMCDQVSANCQVMADNQVLADQKLLSKFRTKIIITKCSVVFKRDKAIEHLVLNNLSTIDTALFKVGTESESTPVKSFNDTKIEGEASTIDKRLGKKKISTKQKVPTRRKVSTKSKMPARGKVPTKGKVSPRSKVSTQERMSARCKVLTKGKMPPRSKGSTKGKMSALR